MIDIHKEIFIQSENELTIEQQEKILEIENLIKQKQIPNEYPYYMIENTSIDRYRRREEFIKQMGFILISHDWIDILSELFRNKKCLEVMSGTGSLSKTLQDKGIDIIATDNFSWNTERPHIKFKEYWTNIENIDAVEATNKYGKEIDYIIMSWAYMDKVAYNVLLTMRNINPKCRMIFIGEGMGGCTADDNFYDAIETVDNDIINRTNEKFKSWFGIYDRIMLIK